MKPSNPRKGKEMRKAYAVPRRYVVVGEYLAQARDKAGLTQREVSLALGYSSAQFISNFERGIAVPPLKKLKIMVSLYDMKINELVNILLDAEKSIISQKLLGRTNQKFVRPLGNKLPEVVNRMSARSK